jgi:cephalosporin-C deacetylase
MSEIDLSQFGFDPAYGYTPATLPGMRHNGAEPADFDAFWTALHARTLAAGCGAVETVKTRKEWGHCIEEIRFHTLDGTPVGGWLCYPADTTRLRRGMIHGHGYGGRTEPEPWPLDGETAVLFPCAPGFHLSADPARFPVNDAGLHVVHGISSPETYVLGLCAASMWSSVDALLARFPQVAGSLLYRGWSFGGGMGALMLPWEPRFAAAELGQPTFGNHPFRLRHPCTGSGEAVRQLWLKDPAIERTLTYFDSVFTSRRIRCPVLWVASVVDPAVPPPGQFTVINECGSAATKVLTQRFGHVPFTWPEQAEEQRTLEAARAWLLAQAGL